MKNREFENVLRAKLMPLKLQFFADGGDSGDNKGDGGDNKSKPDSKDDSKDDDSGEDKAKEQEREKEIKRQAVDEYLKSVGADDVDDLSEIVKKHKENEEKNKTDLEKAQTQLGKTIKLLNEAREERDLAVAQLEALKQGANIDLVEDLVIVAMSKVTKDKDVKKVIAEIKEGSTGSIYFSSDDDHTGGRTVTSTMGSKDKGKDMEKDKDKDKTKSKGKGVASRLLEGRQEAKKSSFFDD